MAGIETTTAAANAQETRSESAIKSNRRGRRLSGDGDDERPKPKGKRKKVNHACVFCRRSHMTCDSARPCNRCIKRSIQHLCHDEPRDDPKKTKSLLTSPSTVANSVADSEMVRSVRDQQASGLMGPPASDFQAAIAARAPGVPPQLVQPTAVSSIGADALRATQATQFPNFSGGSWFSDQNHYHHDMHNYFGPPEVHHELNLFNDFLCSSFLEEGPAGDNQPPLGYRPSDTMPRWPNSDALLPGAMRGGGLMAPPSAEQHAKTIARPNSAHPVDKAGEFYLEAADPHGDASPEEREKLILDAKVKAGLLQPFSYVKGYARLATYLDKHVSAQSKQKILKILDGFRPKFRERTHQLSTTDLILVERWLERSMHECDRLFASMAIPACCWRRTGEIVRANKEMAELLNVPIEDLRGGKIALHQILTEESTVRYWEEFGTIAFDPDHDTLITRCSLKSPDEKSGHPTKDYGFSFRIRRDEHKIPCLIVGNFLPTDP